MSAAQFRLFSKRLRKLLHRCCAAVGAARAGRRLAGVEVVPVHDRVEAERVGALRLPAPERPDREHHDVPLAERMIERRGAVGEELAVGQRARQQHVVRVRRELHHDARTRVVDRDAELLRHLPHLRRVVGRPAARRGRPAPRCVVGLERLNAQRHARSA